jgi:hypothetical protein
MTTVEIFFEVTEEKTPVRLDRARTGPDEVGVRETPVAKFTLKDGGPNMRRVRMRRAYTPSRREAGFARSPMRHRPIQIMRNPRKRWLEQEPKQSPEGRCSKSS